MVGQANTLQQYRCKLQGWVCGLKLAQYKSMGQKSPKLDFLWPPMTNISLQTGLVLLLRKNLCFTITNLFW